MKNKIIVTGGAGFIGSHLVNTLIKLGCHVTVYDNLSTGKAENLNPKAEFIKADLAKPVNIKNAKTVFHLSALPRIERSFDHPIETHQANVTATLNVLKAAAQAKINKFIYSSSSSVYGKIKTKDLPFKETHPTNPQSPYAAQKLMSELYVKLLGNMYGIDTVILRYFNVYGPRMPTSGAYKLVIPIFMELKNQGKPLTIYGSGKQTRDFTHVKDAVNATIKAMTVKHTFKGEIINIGSGQPTTINQLADLIGGKKTYITPNPRAQWEEPHKHADIAKAKKLLQWQPAIKIEAGIQSLLK